MRDVTSFGLVVGIGEYEDARIPKLRFTPADAKAFYEQLVDPQRSGLDPEHVRLLVNQDATRRNIERAIGTWLFRNATPESTVLVFFAGHGALESDKTGSERDGVSKYLLPWDADPEDLFSSALSNTRFQELLNTIKAQRLVVFLDACHAGGLTEGARDIGIVDSPARRIAEGRGRMVIASAHPNQRSWEDATLGHGIFTHHLLEAISGKADGDQDGCVSVMDVFRYLQETVPATARRISNSLQEPEMFGDQISRDVVLTVSRLRVMESARRREEEARLRSAQVIEKRRKLLALHEQGMPPDAFRQALELVQKAPADLDKNGKRLAGLLDALLDEKIAMDVYLGFAHPTGFHAAATASRGTKEFPTPPPPKPPSAAPVPPAVKPRYCIHCGTQVIPTNKFCIGCGRSTGQC